MEFGYVGKEYKYLKKKLNCDVPTDKLFKCIILNKFDIIKLPVIIYITY